MPDLMLLKEVLAVIDQYGELRCSPEIDHDDGRVRLSVSFATDTLDTEASFKTLNMYHELQEAVDLCQMRELAQRYDIQPEALEALLEESRCRRKL